MNQILSLTRSTRRITLVGALLTLALTACGGEERTSDVSGSVSPVSMAVSLTSNEPPVQKSSNTEKTGIGPGNIINMNGPWLGWDGSDTGVTVVPAVVDSQLRLPEAADQQDMVVAVQRVDRPLLAGYEYYFTSSSNHPNAAAVLFLFDEAGQTVTVPGVDGLAIVFGGGSIGFIAPSGIAGFFVQVQNAWQATEAATIRPFIANERTGGGMIDVTRAWTDWAGNPVDGIDYNGLIGSSTIAPPDAEQSLRFGVQRYNVPLLGGQTYDLEIRTSRATSTSPGASSILIFMYDASGQLVADGDTNWISASAATQENPPGGRNFSGSTRFVAPPNVVSFAVQVQGPWQATDGTRIRVNLRTAQESD